MDLKQKAREWLEQYDDSSHITKFTSLRNLLARCVSQEREACAKEVRPDDFEKGSSEWCALRAVQQAIRARGKEE